MLLLPQKKLCSLGHSADKDSVGTKASLCVYTIRHSNELKACVRRGGRGTFQENKKWTLARKLLLEAESNGENLLILFSPAEAIKYLFGSAILKAIEFTPENGTEFTFKDLKRFRGRPRRKGSLLKRDGSALNPNFIRPYAICRTALEL